jgi:Ca2+-binding RTX toxin-like protein
MFANAGLTVGAAITADQFRIGASAGDAGDRFIYNSTTGGLFFDKDGIGGTAQVQFATLSTGLAMTNADIVVFA